MTKTDPNNITNYDRTYSELEQFWLFCMFAAGKNSDWAATKVEQLLVDRPEHQSPFSYLQSMGGVWLRHALTGIRSGQYNRLYRAIGQSLSVDLYNCTLEDLLAIYGVGPKTARLFVVHSRKQAQHAVLDTHILRWMGEQGITVPKTTPAHKKYLQLEKQCIELFQKHYPNLSIAQADLHVWKLQRSQQSI